MRAPVRMPLGAGLLVLLLALGATGCRAAGPEQIRTGRGDYNAAIQQTSNEQLLLNIVRLRYRDIPLFLEVTSIATSFSTEASSSASSAFASGTRTTFGLGAGVSFSEAPTVTYAPLQGEQFVTQMLTPVDLRTIVLLYHSGWSVDRILRLCAKSMNGLQNAPGASGPTPALSPDFRDFKRATALLRELQRANGIELGMAPEGAEDPALLHLRGEEADGATALEFARLLGLPADQDRYGLAPGLHAPGSARIALSLRSVMATMFYVSQSVQVPPEHAAAGLVTITRDEDGSEFDWSELTDGLIAIRSGSEAPANSYVAVPYRGAWFWIDDSDLASKSTFALLMQILALQSGEVESAAPVLTLSVGG
jgi:hypothetical protein